MTWLGYVTPLIYLEPDVAELAVSVAPVAWTVNLAVYGAISDSDREELIMLLDGTVARLPTRTQELPHRRAPG